MPENLFITRVREGLRAILSTVPDIEVTGLAGDGAEALEAVEKRPPDVVLMDLNMPGVNGIQATRRIHEKFPDVRVLALTTYDADEWVTVSHDSTVAESLSSREQEILRLLANGQSNTDIAAQLFLSEGTVRNYVSGIFSKLGVTDRTQAAVIALRHGLVD